ncbi:CGNR zinc finger domain-containing protein [Neorhizobium sp. T6_25]|uniref:CGNR zinc finger domain-containing protein n=1 Tax=Neorhizobium sp. T6_25 TaxID=2093833 RepID=UPI000CF8BABA|nr:CGNR zinc finger domain-containing protein [Neorhizobium sp. T6_25]
MFNALSGNQHRELAFLQNRSCHPAKNPLSQPRQITGRNHRRLVRECKGDSCGWLFLDKPKSGRPLWCSEATCGTHARVKRFRKKQR